MNSSPPTCKVRSLRPRIQLRLPMIALDGTITHENARRVATGIRVYGVDRRFWKFHGRADTPPRGHDVLLSESLARELGANGGDSLLLR